MQTFNEHTGRKPNNCQRQLLDGSLFAYLCIMSSALQFVAWNRSEALSNNRVLAVITSFLDQYGVARRLHRKLVIRLIRSPI